MSLLLQNPFHQKPFAFFPLNPLLQADAFHLKNQSPCQFLRHIPLGRMGLPEEIASAVVYFASDESAYTTGQILTVSGGFGLATPVYGDFKDRLDRR